MKLNHVLLYLICAAIFFSTGSAAISELRIMPDSVNPEPDKLVGFIGHRTHSNFIREISNIKELSNDENYLCLRITGIYGARTCDHSPFVISEPTRILSVEFSRQDGNFIPEGDYKGLDVAIKPVTIQPRSYDMTPPVSCTPMVEHRAFEFDLAFKNPWDGYMEVIHFNVLPTEGSSHNVVLTVTWNNGIWDYRYNL